jgi:prepilin-type N-terminal cleavage/methylation domain-containing protein
MYINRSKGFTLIELLVVIAIIGILSAVVLASLSTARNKGQDAAVQSDLATVQTQAEIYFGNNGNSYGTIATAGTCTSATGMFNDPTILNAIKGAGSANSLGIGPAAIWCNSQITSYVVNSKMTATTSSWCVDSTGIAKYESGTFQTAGTACP